MVVRTGGAEIFVTNSSFKNCKTAAYFTGGAVMVQYDASLHLDGGENKFYSNTKRSIVIPAILLAMQLFTCPPENFNQLIMKRAMQILTPSHHPGALAYSTLLDVQDSVLQAQPLLVTTLQRTDSSMRTLRAP